MKLAWIQMARSKLRSQRFQARLCCTACLFAVSLSFAVTPVLAQGNGSQALSKSQVVKMLERHTPQAEIKRIVLQRHIDFGVTEEVENDLKKNHGASDELISALMESQPQSQRPITPNLEGRPTEQPSHPQEVPNETSSSKTGRAESAVASRTPPPSSKKASTSTILLRADLACIVVVDGKEIGKLQAGETTIRSVGIGQHLVEAKVPGLSLHWQKTVGIDQVGQVIVETELQTVLDANISGNWQWNANNDTADGCGFNTDAWELSAAKNTSSLSERFVRLTRNVGRQDEANSPSSCAITPSFHCIRSFRLELSLPDPASGLHFDSVLDPSGTNKVSSPRNQEDEGAKQFCEQEHSLPTAGFTGTLIPLSESRIRVKLDSLNVDLILSKE
jgi:hypothetical protein